MKNFIGIAAILIGGIAGGLRAEEVTMPGLPVGARAPNFTLASTVGGQVELAARLEVGPVALVFVRSADWCSFCRQQLQALEADLAVTAGAVTKVVAISYDSPEANAAAAAKLGLTFPLLSDVGSVVIDAYGIRNEEAKGRGAGVPHPVVFVVDGAGVVRAKLMREGYRDRPESEEIIAAVQAMTAVAVR